MTMGEQPFLFSDCERRNGGSFSTGSVHFSSASDEWATPGDVFASLHAEFDFTLDVCANAKNAKVSRFYTKDDNGLRQQWTGRVWCNPPYGRDVTGRWVAKGFESVTMDAELVVMLVPSRTDVKWWHDYVMRASEVRFICGRLRFGAARNGAPFPSAIVIFRRDQPMI